MIKVLIYSFNTIFDLARPFILNTIAVIYALISDSLYKVYGKAVLW